VPFVCAQDDWRGSGAGYTPTFPTAWMRSGSVTNTRGQLDMCMVHSGFWDDYNFAVGFVTLDYSAG